VVVDGTHGIARRASTAPGRLLLHADGERRAIEAATY
jgi:hypothetical protein